MRLSRPLFALAAALLISRFAQADTGLVMRCDAAQAATQAAACTGARTWVHPQSGDYVLSYPSPVADSTTVAWSNAGLQFLQWIAIKGNAAVLVCTKDIAVTAIPAGGADPCAPGNDAVAKVFVAASTVPLAPTVPPAATGKSAKLSWIAPTQNTDGSALTDLKGYRIYYGTSATALTQAVTINNADLTSYVIDSLASGTWYFAITAINSAGIESPQTAPTTIVKTPGAPVALTVSVP